jgi:hypothetical protein
MNKSWLHWVCSVVATKIRKKWGENETERIRYSFLEISIFKSSQDDALKLMHSRRCSFAYLAASLSVLFNVFPSGIHPNKAIN